MGSRGSILDANPGSVLNATQHWLFKMALWILTVMQYTDDFNPVRCRTVKQGMAFYGKTSEVSEKFWASGSHQRLLSQQQEMILDRGKVAFGLCLPPLSLAVLVYVLEIIFGCRCNEELMGCHEGQRLISSNKASNAGFESISIPSPRSSWFTPTFSCSRSRASFSSRIQSS